MRRILNDEALDILFRTARDQHDWLVQPVSDTMLRALWELVRVGPNGESCGPGRVVFARSDAAKARLAPALPEAERAAVVAAPCAAIIACPAEPDDAAAARRAGALRAASLILAARALGLDCAPVWQFDAAFVERAFFPESGLAANFVCVLGYGEPAPAPHPEPRPAADEACVIL